MSGGGGGRVCGAPVHNVVVRDVGTDRNLSLQGCVNLVWSVSSQLTTHALPMTSANLPGKLGPQTGRLLSGLQCLHLARCHPQPQSRLESAGVKDPELNITTTGEIILQALFWPR